VKRSLLVEGDGGALGATVDAIIVERPLPSEETPHHLCLDKAYDNPSGEEAVRKHYYIPHIRRIGEEKLDDAGEKRYPARRWVVDRTLSWLSKCRALLVRYDKKASNYLAFLQLACALLWFRRFARLSVLR
jgi:putative transposase